MKEIGNDMANPNKMGMTTKRLTELRTIRFPQEIKPLDPRFEKIINDLQAGKITQDEAQKLIKDLYHSKQ